MKFSLRTLLFLMFVSSIWAIFGGYAYRTTGRAQMLVPPVVALVGIIATLLLSLAFGKTKQSTVNP